MKWINIFSRRFVSVVFSLILLLALTIALMRYVPGDFLRMQQQAMGSSTAGRETFLAYEQEFRSEFLLDEPFYIQLGSWIEKATTFQFGHSYVNRDIKLEDIMLQKFPITFTITASALLFALVVGIPLGILAALKRNSWWDYFLMTFSMGGIAIPHFVMGVGLIVVFSIFTKNFEIYGVYPLSFLGLPPSGWGDFRHLVLPSVALGLAPLASVARFTRSSVLETLEQDWVRTAYSKGLSKFHIIQHHVLRSALIPVITVIGNKFGTILIGSVFVEEIFAIPGLGSMFVQAAQMRDTPMLIASTFVLALCILLVNQIVDLLYSLMDPRIRLE
jgi:peptide/nickel transport system permease protein